jgi:hypothetical protein
MKYGLASSGACQFKIIEYMSFGDYEQVPPGYGVFVVKADGQICGQQYFAVWLTKGAIAHFSEFCNSRK